MDNLAHSLAAAALGEAGLKKKTGLGMATLVIAANLPDVDAFGLFFGENLAWRRGWTHGPIAMLLLPPLLVCAVVLFDRWQVREGRRPKERPPLDIGWLLALAYIGWLSHPLLDFMNTYGIRLLMPFSERWFYGDVLFIIDVWLWMALGLGIWLSRRRQRSGSVQPGYPAIISLTVSVFYVATMGASSIVAAQLTRQAAEARGHGPVRAVAASPVPLNPLRREVVFATDDAYGFGVLNWVPFPQLRLEPELIEKNMDDPAVAEARRVKEVADFLYWSRLPFAKVERKSEATIVTIADARYADRTMAGPFVQTVQLASNIGAKQSQRPPNGP